ncbi:MAG: hypothetical protein FWG09_04140 [Synergistaceae bacterium]|nr:hypothetical protein [Synergistaceae bacterium]
MNWAVILLILALAAMYVKDKTPRQAIFSVVIEMLKGLRLMRLPLPRIEAAIYGGAPIRRNYFYKKTRKDVSHFPILLNLPSSDGSGEVTHPDVLYVPDGWGKGEWSWLMSATPYASGSDYFENPEFYVSHDGLLWTPPAEGINPLASLPARTVQRGLKKEYHSDASLLLRDGTLNLYYRWSGILLDGSAENRICVMTSDDGVSWSESVTILEEKQPAAQSRKFLSPSVLFLNGEYVMWTVEYTDGKRSITRRASADGLNWSDPAETPLSAGYSMLPPWHLDIVPSAETDDLILILTAAKDRGEDAELHYGFGNGHSWCMAGKLIEPGYFFESGRVYRSSLVPRGENVYSLYYSAQSQDRIGSVARLDLSLEADRKFFIFGSGGN